MARCPKPSNRKTSGKRQGHTSRTSTSGRRTVDRTINRESETRRREDGKKKKRTKRLSVQQMKYLVRNLDATVMNAFVAKDVEERASVQFSCYKARSELWCMWKESSKLKKLLTYLSRIFVDLFQQHRTDADPFARFLVSWYESLGKLACPKMSDQNASDLWQQLSEGQPSGITEEDRSALVFAIGASCYTFMRKQVRTVYIPLYMHMLYNHTYHTSI